MAALVEEYKARDRGPYQEITWYCADGTRISSRLGACATASGSNKQHASYLPEVRELGREEHIFLGQILTNTNKNDFWDAENNHSRMKQYQVGNYLSAIDDGWVNRKGQYYRGAFQVEDEMEWGREFLNWMMGKPDALAENFYLIRQAMKDIPHRKDDDLTQKIRNDSKVLADRFPDFMALRIKIHGQPEGKDAEAVEAFFQANKLELERRDLATKTRGLARDIRTAYVDRDIVADIANINASIPADRGPLKARIDGFVRDHAMDADNPDANNISRLTAAADLMVDIRNTLEEQNQYWRLEPMDVSLALENLIFSGAAKWEPKNPRELMEKICYLGKAAAGAGYVEDLGMERGRTPTSRT